MIGRLSPAERRSLRRMASGSGALGLPSSHEATLIELGLAEVDRGRAVLTGAGRRAVALIGGWETEELAATG